MRTALLLAASCIAAACSTASFHSPPPQVSRQSHVAPPAAGAASVYAPFEFLIGDWNVASADGGAPAAVTRFRWGPNRSYIWLSVALLQGNREDPHLEGMLMWNGARKDLDMLLALDLNGGRAQEQGRLYREGASVVREIVAVGPDGTRSNFRQTFTPDGERRVLTSVMRQAGDGWVATFPGSDRMLMTPRG